MRSLYIIVALVSTIYACNFLQNCCKVNYRSLTYHCSVLQCIFPHLKLKPAVMHGKKAFIKKVIEEIPFKKIADGYINLKMKKIRRVTKKLFSMHSHIKHIDLKDNDIFSITAKAFSNLKLDILDLQNNRLSLLKEFQFEGLFTKLLNIQRNGIRKITKFTFDRIEKLKCLLISHNEIEEIEDEGFTYIQGLLYLDLSHNKISQLPLGTFRELISLETLDLSYNRISSLAMGIFTGPRDLVNLHLNNNTFWKFDSKVLLSLTNLRNLDLSQNKLNELDCPALYQNCPTLQKVLIHDNFWKCNVLVVTLQCLRSKHISTNVETLDRSTLLNINGIACTQEKKKFKALHQFLKSVHISTNKSTTLNKEYAYSRE